MSGIDNVQQITSVLACQGFHSPVVYDQDIAVAQLRQEAIIATVAVNLLQLFRKHFEAKVTD